jgi:hypothetical protein
MTLAEAKAKLREVEERIAAQKLAEAEELEPVEFLITQRLYFDAARERAIRALPPAECFDNPQDFETHIQMRMCQETGMTFSNVIFFGAKPATVDECAQLRVDAESGNSSKDRMIGNLKDEIHDLKLQLVRAKTR